MLRSDLCDYSDAYIVVKGKTIVTNPDNDAYDRKLALKNNEPFISCTSKINNFLIDNVEDLDVVMPMYNLLEYSKNYRDEPNSGAVGNINYFIEDSKSSNNITGINNIISITGKLEANNVEKDAAEIVVPLK